MRRHLLAIFLTLTSFSQLSALTLEDRYENFKRSESIFDFIRQDLSKEENGMAKKVFSVMDSEDKQWKIKEHPITAQDYFQFSFIPKYKNEESWAEHVMFECLHDDKSENLNTHWERVKGKAPKRALKFDIISKDEFSMVYAIHGEFEVTQAFSNSKKKFSYENVGIITEFENNLIWCFKYVNSDRLLSPKEREELIDKMKLIQRKFLNE